MTLSDIPTLISEQELISAFLNNLRTVWTSPPAGLNLSELSELFRTVVKTGQNCLRTVVKTGLKDAPRLSYIRDIGL